jgi:hypothetical protein
VRSIRIMGIDTFNYPKSKLKADITTYWKELYWRNNSYLTRYKEIYSNTI